MSGTTFPSNPCYLPIFREDTRGGLERFTDIWSNFVYSLPTTFQSGWNNAARERIQEWNGRLINDAVVFDTEKDKMWFVLRWS